MNKLFAISLISLIISGCSSLGLSSKPTTPAPSVAATTNVPAEAPAATSETPWTDLTRTIQAATVPTTVPTGTLIQVLDAAGCDFLRVQTTEGVARKGSSTLTISCK